MRVCVAAGALALMLAPAAASDFSGFYGGIGGYFGGSEETHQGPEFFSGERLDFRIDSGRVGAFAGYNHAVGPYVFGAEVSLQTDTSWRSTNREGVQLTPPLFTQELDEALDALRAENDSGEARVTLGRHYFGADLTTHYEIREIATPMVSARAGVPIGNSLLYGRGGIGAAILSSRTVGWLQERYCQSGYVDLSYTQTGISIPAGGAVCEDERIEIDDREYHPNRTRVAPTFAAAAGIEYNFDRYFGRVEAEARYIHWGGNFMPSGETGTMRYQVGLGVGIRF